MSPTLDGLRATFDDVSAPALTRSIQQMLISVVVPVYFNAQSLPELVRRLATVAEGLQPLEFEFLFVDDGSEDESFAVLEALNKKDSRVRAIRLSRNFGSNAAILAGLTYSSGDGVVVIAADLQDPPELIPDMVRAWQDGAEVVLAAREHRVDPWLSRIFAATFNRLFKRLVFREWPAGGCDFILVSSRVASILAKLAEKNSYIFGQAMWVGFKRQTVFYARNERPHGQSRWTTLKKLKYFIDAFTAFSYLPVRLASLLGFILAITGFIYAAAIVVLRFANMIQEPGFSAIMVVVLLTGGIELVVIGLIGEYLWRVLEETRQRPVFLIADVLNVDLEHARSERPDARSLARVTLAPP